MIFWATKYINHVFDYSIGNSARISYTEWKQRILVVKCVQRTYEQKKNTRRTPQNAKPVSIQSANYCPVSLCLSHYSFRADEIFLLNEWKKQKNKNTSIDNNIIINIIMSTSALYVHSHHGVHCAPDRRDKPSTSDIVYCAEFVVRFDCIMQSTASAIYQWINEQNGHRLQSSNDERVIDRTQRVENRIVCTMN